MDIQLRVRPGRLPVDRVVRVPRLRRRRVRRRQARQREDIQNPLRRDRVRPSRGRRHRGQRHRGPVVRPHENHHRRRAFSALRLHCTRASNGFRTPHRRKRLMDR